MKKWAALKIREWSQSKGRSNRPPPKVMIASIFEWVGYNLWDFVNHVQCTYAATTTLKEQCERIQHCWATFRRSHQKKCWELLAQKFYQFQTLPNNSHATTRNNMQQGVQTDATCNIEQCWELVANNVASICTGLKPHQCASGFLKETFWL